MISTTQTISKSNFFLATHPRMANSFIILAELKNRDQSLQGHPLDHSNFCYHLLATFDFKILVSCSLFFCCGIVLEDQRIDLLVLKTFAFNFLRRKMTCLKYVISDATEIVPTRLYRC
ncbi:hypothetical protein Bca4012_044242 [Brassica carinata]|uniref:Uncharacterized protein n=1 Tax=Brassica carinata TaxID=52824 RepID=A0A8X7QXG9_BRACI|nr:hypothetical protein Bca52824_058243 [Brassica carinata]